VPMNLNEKSCKSCVSGGETLSDSQITELMPEVSKWSLQKKKIARSFNFKDFKTALSFVNEVGQLAEKENHHPDIQLSWGKVVLELSTHSARGLTENDFILAAKVDQLAAKALD